MASKIANITGTSQAEQIAAQFGFTYPKSTPGNNYESGAARSETINDIATALLNMELENQQFLRNHDYQAEYARLVATGMNPLTAIQALSGGPSSYQPVSAHNTSAPSETGNAVNALGVAGQSARGVAAAVDQIASAHLKDVQAASIPGQMKSLQDLQRSEAALNGFELKFRSETLDSDISAKSIDNRLREMEIAVKEVERDQRQQVIRYQQKQLDWFDRDHEAAYAKTIQDIQESIAREVQSRSQANLNDAQRTQLIPAQVEYMGKQGQLVDSQGKLVSAETLEANVRAVAGKIKNMHDSLGVPYNVAGAILVNDAQETRNLFDQFGKLKAGYTVLDETTPAGKILRSMDQTDQKSYGDAHVAARAAVIQGYINAGAHVVGSVGSAAMGASAASKMIPKSAAPVITPQGSSVGVPFN